MEAYVKGESTTTTVPASYTSLGSSIDKKNWEFLGYSDYPNNNKTLDLSGWIKANFTETISISGPYQGDSNIPSGNNTWRKIPDKYYSANHYPMYVLSAGGHFYYCYYDTDDKYKKYKEAANGHSSANSNLPSFKDAIYQYTPASQTTEWKAIYESLGTSAQLSETFDGFLIPENPTITIKSADCNGAPGGNPSFSTTMNNASATVSPSTDRKSITISGFDFSTNACGNDGSANHGKKLIVTFPVVPCYNSAVNLNNAHSFITSSSVKNDSGTAVKSGIFTKLGQLPNLTITAEGNGVKQTDSFIFTVTGPTQLPATSQKTFKVMIHGTNSVTLKAIPAGTYTVQALDWPWTYTVDNGNKSVTSTMNLSSSSPATASVTFTFTPKSITNPHHGEATASTPAY